MQRCIHCTLNYLKWSAWQHHGCFRIVLDTPPHYWRSVRTVRIITLNYRKIWRNLHRQKCGKCHKRLPQMKTHIFYDSCSNCITLLFFKLNHYFFMLIWWVVQIKQTVVAIAPLPCKKAWKYSDGKKGNHFCKLVLDFQSQKFGLINSKSANQKSQLNINYL